MNPKDNPKDNPGADSEGKPKAIPQGKTARFLRDHNLDPESRIGDRGDAIHLAISKRQRNVSNTLLSLYPEDCLNAKDRQGRKKGRLPLHNAAELGLFHVVEKLLKMGADPNARTVAKWTALILAAGAGQDESINILIQNGANINAQTGKGVAAVHVAAELRSPDILLKLLLQGADPGIATDLGTTPLHVAVQSRSVPAAALLLFHGAPATKTNQNGVSPLDLVHGLPGADRKKFEHAFKCASAGASYQPLVPQFLNPDEPVEMAAAMHWAVDQNLERAVAYLLHIDPYAVEARSPRGWHPLHLAARAGYSQCVSVLLEHGAEVDCITKTGWTPLMLAAENGRKDTVKILLKHNANRHMVNDDRKGASWIANRSGHREIALQLLMRYVAPSSVSKDAEVQDKNTLSPPQELPIRRTPSPGPGSREVEGELYALTDATADDTSTTAPQNANYLEDFLATLERTWYKQVQWSPEDDTNGDGRDWTGPVKIAILDTGVDLNHKSFSKPAQKRTKIGTKAAKQLPESTQRDRIKAYKNFAGGMENNVSDHAGHGTHIAGLILSIAPRAELYIAKVSLGAEALEVDDRQKSASKGGRRESRRPVENALRWAIDQGVDIINLSLGFPRESSYDLSRALEDANHKGIIVFAAAANHGNREAIAWPARDRDLAICVTSGDEFNHISRFAPNANSELPIFITHGEDIYSQWPTELGGGFRKMSGTSVSCPIAVSMAAMILAFLNKTNAWSPEQKRKWLDRSNERRIRSTRGMGRLLEQICRDRNGVKVLSPRLMWSENQDLDPLRVLSDLDAAFKIQG